ATLSSVNACQVCTKSLSEHRRGAWPARTRTPGRLCGFLPILALRATEVYTIFRSYRGVFAVNKDEHRPRTESCPCDHAPRPRSGHEHVRGEVGFGPLDTQLTGALVRHRQQPADTTRD